MIGSTGPISLNPFATRPSISSQFPLDLSPQFFECLSPRCSRPFRSSASFGRRNSLLPCMSLPTLVTTKLFNPPSSPPPKDSSRRWTYLFLHFVVALPTAVISGYFGEIPRVSLGLRMGAKPALPRRCFHSIFKEDLLNGFFTRLKSGRQFPFLQHSRH